MESPDDPIVALATPMASSALAVLRTSGAGSLGILSSLLRDGKDLTAAPGHSLHRSVLCDGAEEIDEVLISVFQAPKSYTGEEGAEISCHGSMPVIRRLLSLLTRAGFRPAGPGEFTRRAFLNGKMDLTRAEAVNEIVRAKTDRARSLALQRLSGAIEKKIASARDLLIDLRAAVEVWLDYPEDELDAVEPNTGKLAEVISLLEGLTRTYRRGRIYQEGVSVAISGATNSGKSSLFNLFLKQERAIVSDIHGTTRDYLEGMLALDGIPVRLFDTAGMREARDPLEAEGIRRALDVIGGADLILYLVDSGIGIAPHDEEFLGKHHAEGSGASNGNGGPALLKVWNKTDLPSNRPIPEGFIPISSLTGEGLDVLEREIATVLLGGTSCETGEPLIDSVRQKDLIERSLDALYRFRDGAGVPLDALAVELAEALEALGGITGEVTTAEILERMFSDFCVGK
jgi:tRNA modification GTPase